jgi:hypothetical protein
MRDDIAPVLIRLSIAAGVVMAMMRVLGFAGISWWVIVLTFIGPSAIVVIAATAYIVWRVKLKPLQT